MKTRKTKLVKVAVRGCIFTITKKQAEYLRRAERAYLIREWNTNNLSE